MELTLSIKCGVNDFATLAAMLQLAGKAGFTPTVEPVAPAAPVLVVNNAAPVAPPAPAAPAAPVAPPAPAAPAAPVAEQPEQPAAPAQVPAFDKNGLPWDARIHSSSKGINADGTWRRRKGIDDATVQAVEAELRARGGLAPAAPVAQAAPPMPAPAAPVIEQPQPVQAAPIVSAPVMNVPMPPGVAPATAPVIQPPAPVAPVMPAPQPAAQAAPPTPAPTGQPVTFFELMGHIQALMSGNRINTMGIAGVCASIQQRSGKTITAITDIMSDPALVAMAADILAEQGMPVIKA